MAKGGMFATDSDVCVAITGIAGPDGGSEDKPVGTGQKYGNILLCGHSIC